MRTRTAVVLLSAAVTFALLVAPLALAWTGVSNSIKQRGDSMSSPHVSISRPIANEASAVEVAWIRQFGTSQSDILSTVAMDASGVYVTGSTEGALPGQTSAGGWDVFIRKYDPSGNEVWTRQFGTPANESLEAMAIDASGVYVAGDTSGTLSGQTSEGSGDAFVRKHDPNGNEIWTRQFGSSASDSLRAVALDASGVYVAGETQGALPGQSYEGFHDIFVRKYVSDGSQVWTREFGTPADEFLDAVAVNASGVYLVGSTEGALPGQTSAGGWDVFIRKYDSSGNEVWTRQSGSSGQDRCYRGCGLAIDASGVYVTGSTEGALPGQTSAGLNDVFVRKYDPDGNEAWTREFGSSDDEYPKGMVLDASGVYVPGWTQGALPGQTSAGDWDVFIRKYDPGGNEVWTRQFGSTDTDNPLSVAIDGSGVYVAGYTNGVLPGQTSQGYSDAFIREYDPGGNEIWTRQFGTSDGDEARSLLVNASGVYVGGRTAGAFPSQTNEGLWDVFVAKLTKQATNTPPTVAAIIVSPTRAATGEAVSLTATSSDPDGDILAYTWDFGDGTSATGTTPAGGGTITATHVYGTMGTYAVTLTVNDGNGGMGTKSATVQVVAPLSVGILADPSAGTAPLTVSFSASPSGGGPPYSFAWDFGDGNSSTAESPTHTYQVAGIYTATLNVTDADGRDASKTTQIAVESPASPVRPEGIPPWIPYLAAAAVAIGIGSVLLWRYRRRHRMPPPSR